MSVFKGDTMYKDGTYGWIAQIRSKDGINVKRRFRRKTDALNFERQVKFELQQGKFTPVLKKHSIKEAIEKYFLEELSQKAKGTQELQRNYGEWFVNNFGSLKLHTITPQVLISIREKLILEEGKLPNTSRSYRRSNSTVNRYLSFLRRVLNLCEKQWFWLERAPRIQMLKEPKSRNRFLTYQEAKLLFERLSKEVSYDVYLVSLISLYLGSRLEETCALKWNDIDFQNRTIHFKVTKTGLDKILPLPDSLVRTLLKYKDTQSSNYLFPTEQISDKPYIYSKVKKGFKRVADACGLTDVSFHILRHTFASWQVQRGTGLPLIGKALGHQDQRTTERYSHVAQGAIEPVISEQEMLVKALLITRGLENEQ